jgi:molybdopterin-guanine dinucleotide biosynthesis protein A
VPRVAGLLLTGGSSRRLGTDKASAVLGGRSLADRAAALLMAVCEPVIEVGPGRSPLAAVREDLPGAGPLAAVAAGGRALTERDRGGPALVLAVDMPRVTEGLLRFLASYPGDGSVVPFAAGKAQPLCARYSAAALRSADELTARGERSMMALIESLDDIQWAGPRMWGTVAPEDAFADVDTPEDATRLGVRMHTEGMVEQ